jgi:hypothetical protein
MLEKNMPRTFDNAPCLNIFFSVILDPGLLSFDGSKQAVPFPVDW